MITYNGAKIAIVFLLTFWFAPAIPRGFASTLSCGLRRLVRWARLRLRMVVVPRTAKKGSLAWALRLDFMMTQTVE